MISTSMPSASAAFSNAVHCGSLLPTTPILTVSPAAPAADSFSASVFEAHPARDAISAAETAAAARVVIRRDKWLLPLVGTQQRYAPIQVLIESRRHMTSQRALGGVLGRGERLEERGDDLALLGREIGHDLEPPGMRPAHGVACRGAGLVRDLDGETSAVA